MLLTCSYLAVNQNYVSKKPAIWTHLNKHQEIRQDTPTSGPQPSRGGVPFVLWKCPVFPEDMQSNLCRITHLYQVGTSRRSQDSSPDRPRDTSELAIKFLYVFFAYRFLSSLVGDGQIRPKCNLTHEWVHESSAHESPHEG